MELSLRCEVGRDRIGEIDKINRVSENLSLIRNVLDEGVPQALLELRKGGSAMCRPKDDGNILSKTTIRLRVWSVSHLQWPRQTGHSHEPRKSVSSQTRLPSPSINHGSMHKHTHPSELDISTKGTALVST